MAEGLKIENIEVLDDKTTVEITTKNGDIFQVQTIAGKHVPLMGCFVLINNEEACGNEVPEGIIAIAESHIVKMTEDALSDVGWEIISRDVFLTFSTVLTVVAIQERVELQGTNDYRVIFSSRRGDEEMTFDYIEDAKERVAQILSVC